MAKTPNYQLGRVVSFDHTTGRNVIEIDGVHHADALIATTQRIAAYQFVLLVHQDDELIVLSRVREMGY